MKRRLIWVSSIKKVCTDENYFVIERVNTFKIFVFMKKSQMWVRKLRNSALAISSQISISAFSGIVRIDRKVCFNLSRPICLLKALKLIWLFVNQRR